MKDSSFYFRHDYNARNDHKTSALISDHGAAGYGIYWCLIEMLHEEPTHKLPLEDFFYRACAKQTSTSVEQVLNTIKDCLNTYKLFDSKDGFFYSERVFRNIQERADIREKRSMAGKISAEKRKSSTSVEQVLNKRQQRKGKEKKGEEIKEKDNNDLSASPSPKPHLFSDSPFIDPELFKQQFPAEKFKDVDLDFYYESMLDWASSKGEKKVDWIATARGFIRRDEKEDKVKLKQKQFHGNGNNPRNLSMAGMI